MQMKKKYTDEITIKNGKQMQSAEFTGTREERLNYPKEKLNDCDSWFETDTFELYHFNEELNDWITKGGNA